jgi:hypothetical protein
MVTSGSFKKRQVVDVGRGMNDPEVTMHNALPRNGLIAHSKALKAAGFTLSLARRVPSPFRSLADQVIRAAASVPANLSEGHGRVGSTTGESLTHPPRRSTHTSACWPKPELSIKREPISLSSSSTRYER